jgi:hypothetical protein
MRSLLAACVLLLVLGGCVFLTTPITQDEHCAIAGTTACATCLRQSCAKAIDGCCRSSLCSGFDGNSPTLSGLDSCGGGDQATCASRFGGTVSPSASTSDGAEAVQACVQTSCKELCLGTP